MKICKVCGLEKSEKDFYASSRVTCRKCTQKRARDWRKANPDKRAAQKRRAAMKFRLGRGGEKSYNNMYISQNGVCAICGEKEREKTNKGMTKHLAVDHDHKTGKTRGLLCKKCNIGISMLGDDLDVLASATSYLVNER